MADRPTLSVRKGEGEARVDAKLRSHVDRRRRSLMGTRSDVESVISDIAQLTQPVRSRFMPNGSGGSRSDRRRRLASQNSLKDGHGTRASQILTNGMNSGLSSPSRKWFRLKVEDPGLMRSFAIKTWLSQVEDILYTFLQGTNFYEAAKSGYAEIGLFGTEAGYLESHWKHGLVCHAQTYGEYWIAEGAARRVQTFLRTVPMTVEQVVERFVADSFDSSKLHWDRVSVSIKNAYDNSNADRVVDVWHLVEPNPAWDGHRQDFAGKPWRSVYWDQSSDNPHQMLAVEGCFEQPFYCARWDLVGGGDPWGIGPGHNALADLRSLQLNSKRFGDGMDWALKPPLIGPSSVKVKLQPGSYTAASGIDKDSIRPIHQVDYQVLNVLDQGVARHYRKIDEHFFVDLFMAITEMDGVQPRNETEIFSRNEEKLTQLGGVITRVNVEKLGIVVDRVFGICERMGLYPEAPEDLEGVELKIDFISILAQAQQAAGLGTLERSLGLIGNLKGAFPSVTDNIDEDAISRIYWERSGAPMEGLRDPEAVAAIRQQRQQQMAAAQARETMPAVESGAKAAELLSRTDLARGDRSLLDALTGNG